MGWLVDRYIRGMVSYLDREGKRLAKEAAKNKEPKNRSKNQLDAFGYIVFYDRKVMAKGYANPMPEAKRKHRGWDAIGVPDGTGREWLDDFMRTWKPESKGFVLIIVNAAFYSVIQEQGRGTLRRKYKVISQLMGEMENIQKQFKGATTALLNT